jgi:hypothetical protein
MLPETLRKPKSDTRNTGGGQSKSDSVMVSRRLYLRAAVHLLFSRTPIQGARVKKIVLAIMVAVAVTPAKDSDFSIMLNPLAWAFGHKNVEFEYDLSSNYSIALRFIDTYYSTPINGVRSNFYETSFSFQKHFTELFYGALLTSLTYADLSLPDNTPYYSSTSIRGISSFSNSVECGFKLLHKRLLFVPYGGVGYSYTYDLNGELTDASEGKIKLEPFFYQLGVKLGLEM